MSVWAFFTFIPPLTLLSFQFHLFSFIYRLNAVKPISLSSRSSRFYDTLVVIPIKVCTVTMSCKSLLTSVEHCSPFIEITALKVKKKQSFFIYASNSNKTPKWSGFDVIQTKYHTCRFLCRLKVARLKFRTDHFIMYVYK